MAYINKEDLLATINEAWECKYARCEWKTLYDLYRMCIRRINRAQVADVVQVVRCKDCAVPHNRWTGCPILNGLVTSPDFYCSYGERSKEVEDSKTF